MTDPRERLEPCAHCGGEAKYVVLRTPQAETIAGHAECLECKARSGIIAGATEPYLLSTVAAAWNRRTPSQSLYPPDEGRTHWEGCWRERGHHGCAVAMIERYEKALRDITGISCGVPGHSVAVGCTARRVARIALGEREP